MTDIQFNRVFYMKRFLIIALALFALSAVSCNKEVADRSEAVVTFEVSIPDEVQTKAYSDGSTASELHYAVYDGNSGDFLFGTTTPLEIKSTAYVNISLVKGYPYDIVFWAQAPGVDYYTFNKSAKTITVNNYTTDANDEKRDAFYQLVDNYYYSGGTTTVKLFRPFAQINFFSSSYSAVQNMVGRTMKSKVKMSELPNVLNVLTGEASGSVEADFTATSVPAVKGEKLTVNGSSSYGYVSMNYILAHKEKSNIKGSVVGTFTYNGRNVNVTVPNVPYQRNFRTNILGSFFTGTGNFTVQIVPSYDPSGDHIVNH